MAHKALLIGSQTGELSGVVNDVTAMADELDHWGFSSVKCESENASRAGILDEYERLIAHARPDDVLVVYYSGHGAYFPDPTLGSGTPSHRTLQLIVPTDFESSVEEDFRGIAAVELSVLLARLTSRTRNVTVVLDCCHSAQLSRDPDQVVKSNTRAVSERLIRAHIDTLIREGLAIDLWHPPGNPDAVRVVACAPEQVAFEASNADGIRMGYLTDALTRSLAELRNSKLTMSWATVIDRVRQRVIRTWSGQRPELEGPAQRVVFGTAEIDPVGTLPVVQDQRRDRNRVRITGAALFGACPGDGFVVMPDGAAVLDHGSKLGDVQVDYVDALGAYGILVGRAGSQDLPLGARAHLVHTAMPTLPVRIVGESRHSDLITTAVRSAPMLHIAADDVQTPVLVGAYSTGLVIHDASGPLHRPRPVDATGTALVMGDLTRMAKARALRTLTESSSVSLTTPVTVEFARVAAGVVLPLPRSGAVIHSGESICVTARNDGEEKVYVSLLDIGVSARISVLNPSMPSGIRLAPGASYVFGGHDYTGALPGMEVSWPASVPVGRPRLETIVVLISDEPTSTHVLEQPGVRNDSSLSRLENYLRQLGAASARDTSPDTGRPVRFAVQTIDFDLVPTAAPATNQVAFQVDDRPAPSVALWGNRSTAAVTVLMSDLVVHHNRAFRHADVRFDMLVVTEDEAGNPEFHARTECFKDISDGKRLVLSDAPIFHGVAHRYLDIAVWVSSADAASADLTTLLRNHPTVAVPPAASAFVESVHQILQYSVNQPTGLYRTTLLGAERFGLSRPSEDSEIRAQDFSFRCAVLPGRPSDSSRGIGFRTEKGQLMSEKHVVIGGQVWGVPSADVEKVTSDIEHAMANSTVVRLSLLQGNQPVTVFFNGGRAVTATLGDGAGPRPTEISG